MLKEHINLISYLSYLLTCYIRIFMNHIYFSNQFNVFLFLQHLDSPRLQLDLPLNCCQHHNHLNFKCTTHDEHFTKLMWNFDRQKQSSPPS
jgi:hypothetical protein